MAGGWAAGGWLTGGLPDGRLPRGGNSVLPPGETESASADSWTVEPDSGGSQPSGGTICTMLPHFGHATIAPMESALRTASFAPQVVHEIENNVSATFSLFAEWMMGAWLSR